MWRTWLLLSVAGGSGERVVEPNSLLQATLRASDSPVQRIGPKETLGIVHIGKTGGSSLDSWLKGNIGRRHLLGHGIHCDMSYMDAQAKKQGRPVRVLSFLREPGTRAASQVLFWNTFKWPLFQKWKNWTLTEIMNEEKAFRRYHNAWGDGFGGVCWMAGTCVNGWYIHTEPNGKNDTEQLRRKELNEKHPQEVLAMAKANLERTAWFGILEDVERSIMLLQWQLGNNYTGFTEHNVNRNPHAKEVTEEDLQRMRKLIPLDMELYHYAQELFERRWAASGLSMPTDTPDRSAGVTGGHGVPLFPQRVPAAELQIESWIDSAASAEPPFPPGDDLLSDLVSGDDY